MNIGFIGCGNMGEAILKGLLESNVVDASQILIHTKTEQRSHELKTRYHIKTLESNYIVAKCADILFLATKPDVYEVVINEIKDVLDKSKTLISITPSYTLKTLASLVDHKANVIRTIPNTPSLIGYGMTGISHEDTIDEHTLNLIIKLFSSFGEVMIVNEDKLPILSSLSGSSPAFIYLFMKAFVDYGTLNGFTLEESITLVSKTMIGASQMVSTQNLPIDTLINNVCSKGGSTTEGVNSLKGNQLESIVQEALDKTTKRFLEMIDEKN
ncbi:MAG TPA: pyrroline-5-carboxylate reductase [Acholeplasmataceae bacterium]|nr:pyrroline-5-carboxylate reductase [Acholeplasmataceae bacterium]